MTQEVPSKAPGSERAAWPKRCACGAEWCAATWQHLPYVGRMDYDGVDPLELRTCLCSSTLAVKVSRGG